MVYAVGKKQHFVVVIHHNFQKRRPGWAGSGLRKPAKGLYSVAQNCQNTREGMADTEPKDEEGGDDGNEDVEAEAQVDFKPLIEVGFRVLQHSISIPVNSAS
jgi:hypothetical protein